MVLLLPPAPAALVLVGRAFAARSARSAAAFLRIAVLGPPGAIGEDCRAVLEPTAWAVPTGEFVPEDCCRTMSAIWTCPIAVMRRARGSRGLAEPSRCRDAVPRRARGELHRSRAWMWAYHYDGL
jgi:hypothetical protein